MTFLNDSDTSPCCSCISSRSFVSGRRSWLRCFRNMVSRNLRTLHALVYIILICGQSVQAHMDRLEPDNRFPNRENQSMTTAQTQHHNNNDYGCAEANRYIYNALTSANQWQISQNQMPVKAISGDHLKICAHGFTCCTSDMENELAAQSKRDYQRVLEDKIIGLRHTFESRTSRFDRFFRELLRNSRKGLHEMFVQTYGMFYEQNADVFTTLFDDLTAYYVSGRVDLEQVMKRFYVNLYQRMFQILNRPYEFDNNYWECVTKHMDKLKPFGEVPQKMAQQVKRAFVATRTFVQSLTIGKEMIHKMMLLPPSQHCSHAVMRMMYCPHCRGFTGSKPCNSFCTSVMKDCLSDHAHIDQEWDQYIDSVLKLLERLEGPFNIESVVEPIDVKISEAIMAFQENGADISSKVFSGCGQPRIAGAGRRKRHSAALSASTNTSSTSSSRSKSNGGDPLALNPSEQLKLEQVKFGRPEPSKPRPTTAAGTSLDRLTRDIREKIQLTRGFWSNLSHSLCSDENVAAPAEEEKHCWNGVSRGRHNGSSGSETLSVFPTTEQPPQTNPAITEQILRLRMVSARLDKAYNGQNVDWSSASPAGGSDSADMPNQSTGTATGSGTGLSGHHNTAKRKSLPKIHGAATPASSSTNVPNNGGVSSGSTTQKLPASKNDPVPGEFEGSGDEDSIEDDDTERRPAVKPKPTHRPKKPIDAAGLSTLKPVMGIATSTQARPTHHQKKPPLGFDDDEDFGSGQETEDDDNDDEDEVGSGDNEDIEDFELPPSPKFTEADDNDPVEVVVEGHKHPTDPRVSEHPRLPTVAPHRPPAILDTKKPPTDHHGGYHIETVSPEGPRHPGQKKPTSGGASISVLLLQTSHRFGLVFLVVLLYGCLRRLTVL